MKISIVCHDLSGNSLGRAAILAELLAPDHAVEITGSAFDGEVWTPAGDRFIATQVRGSRWPRYAAAFARLVRSIDGDVVIASKPLMSSFGAALASRRRTGRPLLLDIDDDEAALAPAPPLRRPAAVALDLLQPNGGWSTRAMLSRVPQADAVTVASSGLQQEFGGTIVTHAKDTDRLRPRPADMAAARAALGLQDRNVVMFFGSPRPWKGVHIAAAAVAAMHNDAVLAVIGAAEEDAYTAQLQRHERVAVFGPRPAAELPFLLQAADIVVVPQRPDPRASRQLPSKLLDAMAVGKPVVATAVGDLPLILGGGRGVIVAADDVRAFADALDRLLDDPAEGARMGARAREWCEQNASYRVVRRHLAGAITEAIARSAARRSHGR